jgi:ArsR family transcriptional regulator, arsenate/arsenite/antimonite-responsive transcriptional repressor
MPRITQPHDDAWSADVEDAVATFGNRSRNEILRYLSAHGPSTRGDIVAAVSAGEPSVAKHLLALEEVGVILVDLEQGRRHGRSPRYSANSARIKQLLDAHLQYLLED